LISGGVKFYQEKVGIQGMEQSLNRNRITIQAYIYI